MIPYKTGLLNHKKWLNGQVSIGENSTSQSGKPSLIRIRIPSPGNLQELLLFPTQSQIHASWIILSIYEYF